MKRSLPISLYFFVLMITSLLAGCDKDERDINLNLNPVGTLYAPDDNLSVKLDPASGATVVFEWESAKAEDGSLVMYELAFDEEGGDFSEPVYKVASDGNGVQNKLTLTHKDLNRIADLAGIAALSTGKLIWTPLAYKGTNVKKAEVSRTIEVERPAGFSVIPSALYLTGDATEGGTDLASAVQMKQVDPGVFEVYTSLKPGNYRFVSDKEGTPSSYTTDGALIREGETQASPATAEAAYRIRLDFNDATAHIMEVVSIGYWFSPAGVIKSQLGYMGGGVWKAAAVPIEFQQESWGRDERYKFQMTLRNSSGEESIEWWGSSNGDNQRATADSPKEYFYLFPIVPNADQWAHSYKFMTEADMKSADIIVSFPAETPYTHQIVIL